MSWHDPARALEPESDTALRNELRGLLGMSRSTPETSYFEAEPTPELIQLADELRREARRRNLTARKKSSWMLLAAALPFALVTAGMGAALAIDDEGHLRKVPGGLEAWVSSQLDQMSSGESRADAGPTPPDATIGRRLRELDKQVARLERQREKLNAQLTACVDHVEMVALGRRLDEVRAELSHAEEEWLTLADEANSS